LYLDVLHHVTKPPCLQGLLKRVCHSKAAASGRELPAADAMVLLESALFTAAREAEPRAATAAGAAFQYLLHVAQGSSAGPSPQVSCWTCAILRRYDALAACCSACSWHYSISGLLGRTPL
jgi:hypothetical protein